jgi:hypothetical protein
MNECLICQNLSTWFCLVIGSFVTMSGYQNLPTELFQAQEKTKYSDMLLLVILFYV